MLLRRCKTFRRATDVQTSTRVLLKKFSMNLNDLYFRDGAAEEEEKSRRYHRALRELLLLKRLSHPHVCDQLLVILQLIQFHAAYTPNSSAADLIEFYHVTVFHGDVLKEVQSKFKVKKLSAYSFLAFRPKADDFQSWPFPTSSTKFSPSSTSSISEALSTG